MIRRNNSGQKESPIKIPTVILLLLLVVQALIPVTALAVPALSDETVVRQPDGAMVKVFQKGDEWNNWMETSDGYTIEKGPDGCWYYVLKYDGNKPVLSSMKAGAAPPACLQKSIRRPLRTPGQ